MGRRTRRLVACAALLAGAVALPAAEQPLPDDGVKPLEAIGWHLFFDPILSRPRNFSCATCHLPDRGYEGGVALDKGAHGDVLPRNTPTVVNLADAEFFFWDGRAGSLEEQASGPITNPVEMDMTLPEAIQRVREQPHYQVAFREAGTQHINEDAVLGALAAFERRLETGPTKFDRWLDGDRSALSAQEERGRQIFFAKGDCALCHNGRHFADGDFHNIGTATPDDVGRSAIVDDEFYLGAFKTPSLRNWKGREPFMHDGRFQTLRDVIDFYVKPPPVQVGEREIEPRPFSAEEIDDLTAFMETLNGEWPDLDPFELAWKELVSE